MVTCRPSRTPWRCRTRAVLDAAPVPDVVDRATWQAQLDELLVREKAHTREGDAIAAARRRLPMVEVDAAIPLIGADGPGPAARRLRGPRQLLAYFHMWHAGQPAADQCEGCTFFNGQVRELSYLHSRDVTYATFCQGPYEESVRYRDFMGWDVPWYSAQDSADALLAGALASACRSATCATATGSSRPTGPPAAAAEAMAPSYGLLDMTVYGRQETWEDSPDGLAAALRRRTATSSAPTDGRPPSGRASSDARRVLGLSLIVNRLPPLLSGAGEGGSASASGACSPHAPD